MSILPENGTEMQEVDRLKLVDGSQPMIKNTSGLLVARDGQALPASETVRVRSGALQLQLGGAAIYHGVEELRPQLGEGAPARARDIERALNLVYLGVALWLAVLAIGGLYLA